MEISELLDSGLGHFNAGDFSRALLAYAEADARGDAQGALMVGETQRRLGRADLAREAYTRAESRGHPGGPYCLGNLLWDAGDLPGAEAAYKSALEMGGTVAHFNYGLLLAEQGRVGEAIAQFELAESAGEPGAACLVGEMFEKLGRPEAAAEAYSRGMQAGDAEAAIRLGALKLKSKQLDAARAAFQRAAELGDPEAQHIVQNWEHPTLGVDATTFSGGWRPDDTAIATRLAASLAEECEEASRVFGQCYDTAILSDKAHALAEAGVVGGVRQQETSKRAIAARAERIDRDLAELLATHKALAAQATATWNELLLATHSGTSITSALQWCQANGVDGDVIARILAHGYAVRCDLGGSKESFFAENTRITKLMSARQ